MDLSDELIRLKNKSKRIRSNLDQARGRKKGLMESLENNFSITNLSDAISERKKLSKKYKTLKSKLIQKVEDIKEKYDI